MDPFAATPDKMLPFARALAQDVEAGLRIVVTDPITPASLVAATRASHQYYEQTWNYIQRLNVVPHACAAGCSFCCSLTVETSAPEALLIAEHLRTTCSDVHLSEVKERLRRTVEKVKGLSPDARARASIPCALLEDGKCSVYAVRPLGCRSWNSRDSQVCAQALREGGGDLRSVQDQRPLGIESGVRAGFAAALHQAGMSDEADRRYELNSALLNALEDPKP